VDAVDEGLAHRSDCLQRDAEEHGEEDDLEDVALGQVKVARVSVPTGHGLEDFDGDQAHEEAVRRPRRKAAVPIGCRRPRWRP
jgi:hypothetical protein